MLEEALKAVRVVGNRFYDTRWFENCSDRSEVRRESEIEVAECFLRAERQRVRHTVLDESVSRAGANDERPALRGGGVFWQGVVYRHPEYGRPLI